MRRPVIAAAAVLASIVLLGGAITATVTYQNATAKLSHGKQRTITDTQVAEYRRVVMGWPYPFAPGDAVPKSPPTGNPPSVKDDRKFVSYFYQCSWVRQAINGGAAERSIALMSLSAWNDLPETISTTDNSDGMWKRSVLNPAVNGDLAALKDYFKSCSTYKQFRTNPGSGMIVDEPLPSADSTTTITTPTEASPGADMIGPFRVEVPVDNGPQNYATGTVTLDADGHPASYKVAPGDVIDYIAKRFGFVVQGGSGFDYLNVINQVRRGGYPNLLYAGDTINLSAYTVLSVGTINGKVLSATPPNPLPPQH